MYKSDQELNIVPTMETRFDLKMPELAQTETMDDNLNASEASSVTGTSLKIKVVAIPVPVVDAPPPVDNVCEGLKKLGITEE